MADQIKEGYRATITDKNGTVMDIIQLGGYDLGKPLAREALIANIQDALPAEAFDPPGEGGNRKEYEECMTEVAKWFVEHRKKLTVGDMRPIAQKYFPTDGELIEFYKYVGSPEGSAEFGRILRLEAWKAGMAGPEI